MGLLNIVVKGKLNGYMYIYIYIFVSIDRINQKEYFL